MAKTAEEMRTLERSLAYESASLTIESACVSEYGDDELWFDVNTADDGFNQNVRDAVEYLESRGLLVRAVKDPNLVQVLDEELEAKS